MIPPMKLDLFVHDCFLEIGHSNAVIETLRNVDPKLISKLNLISYTCDDPDHLFPNLKCKVIHHKVPLPWLKPILLKIIFFHLYTAAYCIFNRNSIKISIGIATLCANLINIQFIHSHWEQFFFNQRKLNLITYIYKKTLFLYFRLCENYLYNKKGMLFSSLSRYVTNFCLSHFKIRPQQIKTIYSAVNLSKYSLDDCDRFQIYSDLCLQFPQLNAIDPKKPIFLFVGAFERKGLPFALDALKKIPFAQIVIIGKPESGTSFSIPRNIPNAIISHTSEIQRFYQLCDNFIFPTHYEPFGLVIAEAAAMGMRVYATTNNVGATEILGNLDEIYLFPIPEKVFIKHHEILTNEMKTKLREERISKVFSQYSWQNAGIEFQQILIEISQLRIN